MFKQIAENHGGVDVCINNAGLNKAAPLLSGDTEDWREIIDVNVLALSVCTREAVKSMRGRNVDDGHIIHINSVVGHKVCPNKDFHMLIASKYAVTALTEGLRNELREIKSNIRITAVSPGTTKTEAISRAFGENVAEEVFSHIKYLSPDEVADAVLYALAAPPHVQVHEIIVGHIGDTL